MKKSFIIHCDSLSVIDKMTDVQVGLLFRMMKAYHSGEQYECDDIAVELVFEQFKNQFDRDLVKYNEICERNTRNGKLGGRPKGNKPTGLSGLPNKPTGLSGLLEEPRKADSDSDSDNESDNDSDKKDDTIVSQQSGSITGVGFDNSKQLAVLGEKEKSSAKKEKDSEKEEFGNPTINNIIETIKNECLSLGVAYDSKMERNFARHIATAKQYGLFAEDLGQSRLEFAINILRASIAIDYFKGPTSGPKAIYQNYADVYNKTKMKQKKRSSVGIL